MPGPRKTGKVSMAFQESYSPVRMVWSYFNNLEREQTEVAHAICLASDCLDTELSIFMQQLRVQGAAGEPGRA